MKDELNRQLFREAIDTTLSGLQEDPYLAQRVRSLCKGKEEIVVKKKLSVSMILIAVLIFVFIATAVAAVVINSQKFVEEVAVPHAVNNDGNVGVNGSYSAEEIADMIRVLSENGITFDENNRIMQAFRSGQGYYEEEFIMEVCRQAFGGNFYTWTLDKQDWFNGIMVDIGWYETKPVSMPGEGNMTYEEAEAFAFSRLKAKFGEDLHPEDRSIYILSRQFYADMESGLETWSFTLDPRDVYHGSYSVRFADADPVRTVYVQQVMLPDWEHAYSANDVMSVFRQVYSWDMGQWTQEVWQLLHEMMLNAQLDPLASDYAACKGYQLTKYPSAAEDEIGRENAISIAKDFFRNDRAVMNSAVLTEYEGQRAWMVGLIAYAEGKQDIAMGDTYVITVDSHLGKVESVRKQTLNDDISMPFVPQSAYEKAREGILTNDDYLRLAAEAVQKRYPGLDVLDPEKYDAFVNGMRGSRSVRFKSKDILCGNVTATVSSDGIVSDITADTAALTGNNILERYRNVYGYFGNWDQSIWARMEQDALNLDASTIDGIILKETVYPEEKSVPVGHEKAQEAAIKATGKRIAEVNTCVLVNAEPNPVWIIRLLTDDPLNPVIGIDAVTGETVFTELFKTDYTPVYVLYSLPETWRPIELKMLGVPVVARREVSYRFGDMSLDEPEIDLFSGAWKVLQEGLTVRFESNWAGIKSYEAELSENGFVLRCEEIETTATEPRPVDQSFEMPENVYTQVPPPQADGKPWFFGKDFETAEFWDLFDARMTEYGVTAENFNVIAAEWEMQSDREKWSQDQFVLFDFMIAVSEEDFEFSYPVFVREGKPGQQEIYALAVKAFHGKFDSEMSPEWTEMLYPCGLLNNNGMHRQTLEMFGRPVWWINMCVPDDTEGTKTIGYVQLDEDGNILEIMYEPFSNG